MEAAYQKILKEVVNTSEELPDSDMKMSAGNLDKLDKSNLYTQEDDRDNKDYVRSAENFLSDIKKFAQQIQDGDTNFPHGKDMLTGKEFKSDYERIRALVGALAWDIDQFLRGEEPRFIPRF